MNIMARINARKIVLSYFYQRNFFLYSFQQENIISDVLFANDIFASEKEQYWEEKEAFNQQIQKTLNQNAYELLDYIIVNFFDQWSKDTIDMDYIFSVGLKINHYHEEIKSAVNRYVDSFEYEKMSMMNQALFALGYIEWKELRTEKEILINEMIELAKRYDETWSPKLINAVMHKIISQET